MDAQAEALGGVEAGALQLAVVPAEGLRLVVFQEQLAVVGTLEGVADDALEARAVETGAGEEQLIGPGDIGHGGTPAAKGCRLPLNIGGRGRKRRGLPRAIARRRRMV